MHTTMAQIERNTYSLAFDSFFSLCQINLNRKSITATTTTRHEQSKNVFHANEATSGEKKMRIHRNIIRKCICKMPMVGIRARRSFIRKKNDISFGF